MSIIEGLLAMLGNMESDVIAVHEERCISVRNRNASCLRCVAACTSGAISSHGNELTVEPERCIGCGTCATACPTSAIEIRKPTDEELTALVKRSIVATKGHPVVACATAVEQAQAAHRRASEESTGRGMFGRREKTASVACDPAKVVELPCLGRVDESLLVGLSAYKASDVTLVCGDCENCKHVTGGTMVREVVKSAQSLVKAFGSDFSIELVSDMPEMALTPATSASAATLAGVSRRDFFKGAKDGSVKAVGDAVQNEVKTVLGGGEEVSVHVAYRKVGDTGELSHFVPSRRVRLYNYLNHVGQPVAQDIESRVVGSVSIDSAACDGCRMCAVFCPTGAIEKMDGEGVFGVMHRPSACMQCRLCERICPKGAVQVSNVVPARQFMGKEAVRFDMERPTWTPNRPESMYDKVHSVIGSDLEMCMF